MSKWQRASNVVATGTAIQQIKVKPKNSNLSPNKVGSPNLRRPSLDKKDSWKIKAKTLAKVDLEGQAKAWVIDYGRDGSNNSHYNEQKGDVEHERFGNYDANIPTLLQEQKAKPEGCVRWTNLDIDLDHPGQIHVLNCYLSSALGPHAAALALESISASGQRARMQFFNGVFFLLSKIPSMPDEFAERDAATIFRLHDELLHPSKDLGKEEEGFIEFELIIFIVDPKSQEVSTIQVGKEGDVWDDLRSSLKEDKGGHHDVRNRSAGILLWNLLNEALRECDHIDESFEAIIAPMLNHFETGEKIVSKDDHRMATALKSEMSAISRQVHPLRDVFVAMADHDFPVHVCTGQDVPEEVMYFEDLRDKSLRIIDNISDHADHCTRLQEALVLSDDRRDAKVQFFISVTLAVFSPLSFVVGFYGMNFVGECPPDHDGLSACKGGIPELFWPGGYIYVWILIAIVSVSAIVSFWVLGIISLPRLPWARSKHSEAQEIGIMQNPATSPKNGREKSTKEVARSFHERSMKRSAPIAP
ncbi:hypothetical protein TrLO_g4596 [Triparma laevis f. longispina]|uniref:Magnesium transporter n=1 Tax=Triparma laevis f. longispina TaxID=1714387 RepID=A0A9W7FTC3_9STRA|nr:hypothetical protein TrLO_g4596 [Triparma laevis f. longispina]